MPPPKTALRAWRQLPGLGDSLRCWLTPELSHPLPPFLHAGLILMSPGHSQELLWV